MQKGKKILKMLSILLKNFSNLNKVNNNSINNILSHNNLLLKNEFNKKF